MFFCAVFLRPKGSMAFLEKPILPYTLAFKSFHLHKDKSVFWIFTTQSPFLCCACIKQEPNLIQGFLPEEGPGPIGVQHCLLSYLYSQAALPFFTSQCSNLLLSISKYTFCTPWSSFKILARGIFHLKCTSCVSSVPRKLKPGNLKGTTGRSKLEESYKIRKSK